ncbi:cupin domain-containing protein [Ferviditalea candida]|uniref:Cupin domain-containing protein n=1 Tax=Ferviditalea candida TaxID=3108399 RepID=A0ABU5ZC02_9BACL|nr:cupin domain-containing protein [Paenibacillaceae bacterium T2]
MSNSQEHAQFSKDLERNNLGPLWDNILHMVTKEPDHDIVPYLWKLDQIKEYLYKAGDILKLGRTSERRVIYLQNPSLMKKGLIGYSTYTLYAGIQLLLPGEVAPSHRHSQSAIRFVIEGDGAYTSVDGEKLYMEKGDCILTPPFCWHDHGHEGNEPMIWMDGLDVGIVKSFAGSFYEPYANETYPLQRPDDFSTKQYSSGSFRPVCDRGLDGYPSPQKSYKWNQVKSVLEQMTEFDPDPFDGYAVDYMNPVTGGSADYRIGTTMQKLTPGMRTKAHRHVHSAVYHVMEGNGYTVIDGVKFEWSKGDFFILPPWRWHEHVNTGDKDAHLFSFNDRPVLQMLKLERNESLEQNNGRQEIKSTFSPEDAA